MRLAAAGMTSPIVGIAATFALAGALVACGAGSERTQNQAAENSTEAAVQSVTSKDGTGIAYDKQGSGPPLIIVNGALADRTASEGYAKLLSPHFTVYSFDRRGRGDSGDAAVHSLDAEADDIAAVVDGIGGLEVSLFQFHVWKWTYRARISITGDVAVRYANGGVSVGFWH